MSEVETSLKAILSDTEIQRELLASLEPQQPARRPWGIVGGRVARRVPKELLRETVQGVAPPPVIGDEREAIIRLFGRPVLFVRRNSFNTETFDDPESRTWADRLEGVRPRLEARIPSVGRIEVRNHPSLDWVGTGWLLATNILVTNRHVAAEFASRNGTSVRPTRGPNGKLIRAGINFHCEYDEDEDSECPVEEVVYLEDADGPDLAFLRLRGTAGVGDPLPQPISLSPNAPRAGQRVVTIGYPAEDGRRNDPLVMDRIFGGVYGFKRLAPGEVLVAEDDVFTHDCTTLGGNSGSVVLDLESGEAVGLHFGGRYGRANFAVPVSVISDRLQRLQDQGSGAAGGLMVC